MNRKSLIVDSPLGKLEADHIGSPVGVVRMDPAQSYAGIGELLQEYINYSKTEAWEKIRTKIEVSGAGELPPCALSEPDLNLSAHPAPIIQP